MKNVFYFIVGFTLLTIFVTSCEKDKDTTKPIITIQLPNIGDTVKLGADINYDVYFEDDIELKAYKIDIHSNTDGHSHEKSTTIGGVWDYEYSADFNIGSKKDRIVGKVPVPKTVENIETKTGAYHFIIYCTDAAGNEAWIAKSIVVVP